MTRFTEAQRAEAAALDSFRNKPQEVDLETWAAVGAKFKRQGRRGISQSQNIARGVQELVNQGLSLEEVLTTEQYQFADTSWRLCDFVAGPIGEEPTEAAAEEDTFIGDEEPSSSSLIGREPASSSFAPAVEELDSEEEVVIEDEEPSPSSLTGRGPASSSSIVPAPPASRKHRISLPANVPQPLRPVIASIPDGVRCFDYDIGRGSWAEINTFYKPRVVDCGILVVDYHHVLDRLSSAWPVRGAPVPPANIDCLRRIKREVPNLKVYCISQLTSPATLRDLLSAFGNSPECGYWNIGAIHIAYPGLRQFCSSRFERFPGLLEAEPSILREKQTRPSVRVADR